MLEMARNFGFDLKEISSDLSLTALEDDWSAGYFYAEVPLAGGSEYRRFIYRAQPRNGGESKVFVPLQFGREVLAAVTGKSEIGHWKACVLEQDKEKELTEKFRTSLESGSG